MTIRRPRLHRDEFDEPEVTAAPDSTPTGPVPFSCYLRGQIGAFEPIKLYLNFLRPKSEQYEPDNKARLSISLVLGGVAFAERPIHIEWQTEPGAIYLIQRAIEAGWELEKKAGLHHLARTSNRRMRIDPQSFLAVLFHNWLEKQGKDPRFEPYRKHLQEHSLAS